MPPSIASANKKSGTRKNHKKINASLTIFESEFHKLNDAQRKAVEAIEGPVMVIAGPGTGKTQTLSMRVANILKKTQMRPSNILCLTFSVSGATAMRDRLRLLIGADAYGVTVSTIHGFAQSIMDREPSVFEEWSMKQQLSDVEKYREMNTILDQLLPHVSIINPKDPYARDTDLLSRISQVKREGKTLEDLERVAREYGAEMAGKSREGTKAHEKNLLAARKFKEFVEIFRRYQEMLTTTQRYDYDDMILSVLRALGEEDWLLASLQERYQYILVDEFQDTNGAQWNLIDRLTRYDTLPHDPNLFIVGDDDQAIYRFQGANIANMLSFRDRFPRAPTIPLTVSYRSTQRILHAAERMIEHNADRLVGRVPGLQKHLTASSGEEGIAPTLLRAASDTAEPWLIADLIDDRMRSGIPSHEIAVLTQTNAELFPLYDTLCARGIPSLLHGKADLLTHPLVSQALAILATIEKPENDGMLARALACDCFALHPADLARVHRAARDRKQHILAVLESLETDETLTLSDRDRFLRVRDVLLSFHQKIDVRTVLETVEHVLRESALIHSTNNASNSSPEETESRTPLDPLDLAAVEAFFGFVKRRCLDQPGYSFRDFHADLRFYSDPLYGQVRLTYQLPHLVTTGVQLLTAHQSKGLEFAAVILVNFRDGHWDKRRSHASVAVPEDLLFGWGKEQKAAERREDERRVAYVAMTRAKRELLFTCPRELTVGEKMRTVSPSSFFAEAGVLPELDGVLRDPERASLLLRPAQRVLDEELAAYIREKLTTFALSATSLRRFLHDPQEFLMIDLLEQPEHFDEGSIRALSYGSAVHWALREWAMAWKEGKPFDLPQLLLAFSWHLREHTILTDKQRADVGALGQEALEKYFEAQLASSHPFIHAVERPYRAHLGEIPIKGKIDRIDLASATSAHATVFDYKTGAAKTDSDIRGSLDPGAVSRASGGDYFRQLAFYALLLEHGDPLLQPQAFVLDFIGERGEHPIQRSFVITEAEKKDLTSLIGDVWKKIQGLDFSPL
ncbi:ATP-dependent helicase [Candidatus Peregrinibacteria bacterium]|nr:ATP-dependent helicase [Candidatus Peregrinibacteria bacterium]